MCQNCVKITTEISAGVKKTAFEGFQDAMFLTISDENNCESFMFAYEMHYHHLIKTVTKVLLDEVVGLINEVLKI